MALQLAVFRKLSLPQKLNPEVPHIRRFSLFQVSLLEGEVERKKLQTDELEARLSSVEKEFESYKVRAQSVLRQAKEKVKKLFG